MSFSRPFRIALQTVSPFIRKMLNEENRFRGNKCFVELGNRRAKLSPSLKQFQELKQFQKLKQ